MALSDKMDGGTFGGYDTRSRKRQRITRRKFLKLEDEPHSAKQRSTHINKLTSLTLAALLLTPLAALHAAD